jgi:hypothetical protein
MTTYSISPLPYISFNWFARNFASLFTTLDVFKLELLLLVLNDDVAELPLESSRFVAFDLYADEFFVCGAFSVLLLAMLLLLMPLALTNCGMLRFSGDLDSFATPRFTFAALCMRKGDTFGCSIFVDFIGFADGRLEFLLDDKLDDDDVVGLIDDSFVYTEEICVLLRVGDDLIVIEGICCGFDILGDASGCCGLNY